MTTLGFKRIVSQARKRSSNPQTEKKILQDFMHKFAAIVPEDGGVVEKLSDIFFDKLAEEYNSYVLEIGFGSGENILFNSQLNPNIGYVGCEVFTAGVVDLIEGLEDKKISNVRIWHDDALDLITRLPLNSLNLVYILHPDPWPKRRHNKRRLINAEFLSFLHTKIAPKGELLIITDHQDYSAHIDSVVEEVANLFSLKFGNYPSITKTKYRLKADNLGHESKYFYLVKK